MNQDPCFISGIAVEDPSAQILDLTRNSRPFSPIAKLCVKALWYRLSLMININKH